VGGQNQTVPFLPSNFGGLSQNATVSPLLIVTPANTQFGAAGGASPKWLQASLAINGQNVGQTSALVVNIGRFLLADDTGTVVGSGQMRGAVSFLSGQYFVFRPHSARRQRQRAVRRRRADGFRA
jgi:hypothetical protein